MSISLKETVICSIDEVVHSLRIGDNGSGHEELMKLIDYLMLYTNSIKEQSGGSDVILMINQILPHLMTTMQNKDYVFMSDILKYELKPEIEEF